MSQSPSDNGGAIRGSRRDRSSDLSSSANDRSSFHSDSPPAGRPASGWHLAQYNIAWLVAPLDDPRIVDFKDNIERVNRLAEEASGFVWRHQTADGDSTAVRIRGDDRILINFSVWESVETLFEYAFHSGHVEMYRRRREWFEHLEEPYAVLWWVPAGHEPTVEEAEERLRHLAAHGPSARAFTFKSRFPAPSSSRVSA